MDGMTRGLVEELKPEVEKALTGVKAQEPEPLIREVFGSASAQFRVSAAAAAAEIPLRTWSSPTMRTLLRPRSASSSEAKLSLQM